MSGGTVSNWIEFNQKNKPQGNALAGGIMIMLVSGLQIGWIFNSDLMNFPWTTNRSSTAIIVTYVSFYIAAVFGLYAATIVINRLTKTNIYVSFWFKEIAKVFLS